MQHAGTADTQDNRAVRPNAASLNGSKLPGLYQRSDCEDSQANAQRWIVMLPLTWLSSLRCWSQAFRMGLRLRCGNLQSCFPGQCLPTRLRQSLWLAIPQEPVMIVKAVTSACPLLGLAWKFPSPSPPVSVFACGTFKDGAKPCTLLHTGARDRSGWFRCSCSPTSVSPMFLTNPLHFFVILLVSATCINSIWPGICHV